MPGGSFITMAKAWAMKDPPGSWDSKKTIMIIYPSSYGFWLKLAPAVNICDIPHWSSSVANNGAIYIAND